MPGKGWYNETGGGKPWFPCFWQKPRYHSELSLCNLRSCTDRRQYTSWRKISSSICALLLLVQLLKITQNNMYRPARLCYTDINSREKAKKGVFAGLRACAEATVQPRRPAAWCHSCGQAMIDDGIVWVDGRRCVAFHCATCPNTAVIPW